MIKYYWQHCRNYLQVARFMTRLTVHSAPILIGEKSVTVVDECEAVEQM